MKSSETPLPGLTPRVRRVLTPWLTVVVCGVLAVGFLPLAWWSGCVFAAFRVWLALGYWPYYGHPDPGQLPREFGPIPSWSEFVVPPLILVALTGGGLILMNRLLAKRWWLWGSCLAIVFLWAGSYGLFLLDPWGVLDWAFD